MENGLRKKNGNGESEDVDRHNNNRFIYAYKLNAFFRAPSLSILSPLTLLKYLISAVSILITFLFFFTRVLFPYRSVETVKPFQNFFLFLYYFSVPRYLLIVRLCYYLHHSKLQNICHYCRLSLI